MKDNINAVDENGSTQLFIICHFDSPDHLKSLLNNGANPNIANPHGFTPLSVACNYGYPDHLKMLLSAGAVVDPKNLVSVKGLLKLTDEQFAEKFEEVKDEMDKTTGFLLKDRIKTTYQQELNNHLANKGSGAVGRTIALSTSIDVENRVTAADALRFVEPYLAKQDLGNTMSVANIGNRYSFQIARNDASQSHGEKLSATVKNTFAEQVAGEVKQIQ
jgi:hypothetical protein